MASEEFLSAWEVYDASDAALRAEATRLRARADAEAVEAAAAAAPAAEATASESVASLHERLLEGKMLLDEEMATLRLEAAKGPEKPAAGGRKSLAERMAEKHGIALEQKS